MRAFQQYVTELTTLVRDVLGQPLSSLPFPAIVEALNGGPSRALNELIDREELRDSGVFFSGTEFAARLVERIRDTVNADSVILDPACGTGDLLVACSRALQVSDTLPATISSWSDRFVGRDIFAEFIDASKLRLILSAVQMLSAQNVGSHAGLGQREVFPNIRQHCELSDPVAIESATHILMNPPFALVDAPPSSTWASGKVNAAALFVDECLTHARPGVHLVAILPDVLRSGSRYKEWRRRVESRASVQAALVLGQFDARVDVDVFLLHLITGQSDSPSRWNETEAIPRSVVSDHFEVNVGAVVDYRDPHTGAFSPFAKSRGLAQWETVRSLQDHRHFAGRLFSPPFVVVRRTSRHGDRHRAIATIIDMSEPVAVENHLLVLSPRNRSLKACEQLVSVLRDPSTDTWLDDRIRCRHLTVSALKEIPWRPDSNE